MEDHDQIKTAPFPRFTHKLFWPLMRIIKGEYNDGSDSSKHPPLPKVEYIHGKPGKIRGYITFDATMDCVKENNHCTPTINGGDGLILSNGHVLYQQKCPTGASVLVSSLESSKETSEHSGDKKNGHHEGLPRSSTRSEYSQALRDSSTVIVFSCGHHMMRSDLLAYADDLEYRAKRMSASSKTTERALFAAQQYRNDSMVHVSCPCCHNVFSRKRSKAYSRYRRNHKPRIP